MLFRSVNPPNTANGGAGSGPGGGSFPGGGGGGGGGSQFNVGGLMGMFSRSAQTMQDMMKRLHPEGEKAARELVQKTNQGQSSQQLFEINKKTLNDGDPFKAGVFDVQFGPK